MTTETASDAMNTTNKRVRFSNQDELHTPQTTTTGAGMTPKATSIKSVRNFAATLRTHLSPIVLSAGLSHIDLLHKWSTKCRQHGKMENDVDFIPRSARFVHFDFEVSKQVETSEEFQEVKAQTDLLIQELRLNLKDQVMEALKIEILILRKDLYINLVKEIYSIIQGKLLVEKKDANAHLVLSTIMHYNSEDLLDSFDTNKTEFCNIYREHHALQEFPIPNAPTPTQDNTIMPDEAEPPEAPAEPPNQTQAIANRDLARTCLDFIRSTFLRPTALYFNRLEEIEIDLSLKKLHFTAETEDKAAATKARMDLEPSASPELVRDLIRGQVQKDTKNLRSEVGQLKKQLSMLNAKNLRGGPTLNGGASKLTKKITKKKGTQRKKTPPPSPKDGTRKPRALKAGARGKDSNTGNSSTRSNKNSKKNTRRN